MKPLFGQLRVVAYYTANKPEDSDWVVLPASNFNSFFGSTVFSKKALKAYVEQHPPSCGDGESVLAMLYECHNENNPYDKDQIKADFNELYQRMNGMPLQEMDKIIYPVYTLCRDFLISKSIDIEKFRMYT